MITPLLFALPGNENLVPALAQAIYAELGELEVRRFPDGESYVRLDSAVDGRDVVLLATLPRPDYKVMPLLYAAMAARELGARRIGLVAPYLAYMRQDRRFRPGEAVTSRYFAKLLSDTFDWLVTVDPHLHRYASLDELYTIPGRVVASAPALAHWIHENITNPVLIGPDAESAQWVSDVAARAAGAPFTVLTKIRRGDRDVDVSLPDPAIVEGRTPVLVDDIISTAGTMAAAGRHLARLGTTSPVAVAVHGIFAGNAETLLQEAGITRVVTSNTVPHPTNAIDICGLLKGAVTDLLQE